MKDDAARAGAWADARTFLFAGRVPSTAPVLLSVGAQPGAGKTRAIDTITRELYAAEQFVSIIGDDLRQFHHGYTTLVRSADPKAMPAATAELSGWLVGRTLAHAAEHHYSTVVEGTLRRPATTLNTIRQFAEQGASTHLVVLGVSPFDSWSGCIDRYLTMLESGRAARWTPLEAHDAGLAGTPGTLTAAASDLGVHRLSVVDRTGTLHYDNTRGPDGHWLLPEHAVAVLEELRSRPTDPARRAARLDSLSSRAAALHVAPVVNDGITHAGTLAPRSRRDALTALSQPRGELGQPRPPRHPRDVTGPPS